MTGSEDGAHGGGPRKQDPGADFVVEALLKQDLFGRVERGHSRTAAGETLVRRDWRRAALWVRPLARHLADREQRALRRLEGLPGLPRSRGGGPGRRYRSWLPGRPLQEAAPRDPAWYGSALRLLAALHRRGVTHNDLAKEPNWLVLEDGSAALVDFQMASVFRRRGWRFRLQAREDLRHLLKHKRSYWPERLTPRDRRLLAAPSLPARLWRRTGKRLYLLVTRRWLGWADREGAGDRGRPAA